jgi:hypothetical protein
VRTIAENSELRIAMRMLDAQQSESSNALSVCHQQLRETLHMVDMQEKTIKMLRSRLRELRLAST